MSKWKQVKSEPMDKYIILILNLAHPVRECVPFLLQDENDNTILFDDRESADKYVKDNCRNPFAMTVISIEEQDFTYQ